jgi:serine/threonine-protein kinase
LSDTLALSWLDQLLRLDPLAQAEQLQQLAHSDPALHRRLVRLLSLALSPDDSHGLDAPVLEGLRMLERAAAIIATPGNAVAGYSLLRELGRGGMSVVWLAERTDGSIKRQVALKLPIFALTAPNDAQRFSRETDVLAGLTHPNIARLYDAGVTNHGQPFIVLELIDGLPITAYCDLHQLTLRSRLELFLQVLAAVGHAHKHLVVHRDLKPANILVSAQGQVKLLDFGIAKLLAGPDAVADVTRLTQHGGLVLTPLYAAPEQIKDEQISTAADIYAMGVILYELLTGRSPYASKTGELPAVSQMLHALSGSGSMQASDSAVDDSAALKRGFANAGKLRSALRGDLDTIIQKTMRQAPSNRYASAEHFAEDLRRFLDSKPIAARPPGILYILRLWLARHQGASIAAAIGSIGVLIAITIAIHQYQTSREQEARVAAVRTFMFDLVNDTEPNELHPDTPVTGKQILDNAVARVHRQFGDRRRLQGELLSELGRMYSRFDQSDASKQTLLEALKILMATAPPDDPALNKTRAYLASVLYDEDQVPQARKLSTDALKNCSDGTLECAKAHSYADIILSQIERQDGDADASLKLMHDAVAEATRAFGEHDPETIMTLVNLAVTARNSGFFSDARTAIDRAVALSSDQTLRARDRVKLSRSKAIVDFDLGNYAAARTRLRELATQTVSPSERALDLRLLSMIAIREGDAQGALDAAGSAISLANSANIPGEVAFATQARALALAMSGDTENALREAESALSRLLAGGSAEDSPEILRSHRFRAEILLRGGDSEGSRQEIESELARLNAQPGPSSVELGQALDLLGCALRELGKPEQALATHRKAREQFQKQLPPDHPFLDRNTLYMYAATASRASFAEQAERIAKPLPPGSFWRTLMDAWLDPEVCRKAARGHCALVL